MRDRPARSVYGDDCNREWRRIDFDLVNILEDEDRFDFYYMFLKIALWEVK